MRNSRIIIGFLAVMAISFTAVSVFAHGDHDHKQEEKQESKKKSAKHDHEKESKGKKQDENKEDVHKHGDAEQGDEHGHEEEGAIVLSEESQQLANIKTEKITRASFARKIPVSGRIAQDVEEVKYVFSSESGTIKECRVSLGMNVKQDQVVCVVALNRNNELLEVKSPIAGTVISEFIKKGEHVDETTAIYAIADMERLWANFDIYEKDVASIQMDQKMLIRPLSYPNKSFNARIVFISPRVDESTYTVKIRAEVENTKSILKLGMSVRGDILIDSDEKSVVIPTEAIQTVENKSVVFKKTDEGFEPQEVKILSQTKETTAIESGIEEGDEIAVKGAFILKSKTLESEMGHDHAH